jgi:GT2 family glycosyltransferase
MSNRIREVDATVIVPTYNRAQVLRRCLDAVACQSAGRRRFELVVVDNNSSDETPQVVAGFAEANPELSVRYFRELKQGASHARNRGISEARGGILCFLDDDSPPDPNWLETLLGAFDDATVGCAGGPSVLDYQGQERPPWLYGDLQGLLSGYGLPYRTPTAVTAFAEFPLGCNVAFRREVFDRLGCLRTDLDRCGGDVLAAGDTEMIDRARKAGWQVLYLPDAKVNHLVEPSRLAKSHLYRVGAGLAKSHIILTSDRRAPKVLRFFLSDMWYATRMFFALVAALVSRKQLWFDDYMRFWMVGMRIPLRLRSLLMPTSFFPPARRLEGN